MDPITIGFVASAIAATSALSDIIREYRRAKRNQHLEVNFDQDDRPVVMNNVTAAEARAIVDEVLKRGPRATAG